ncbi:MAG TPA: alpha/beta hydrolase, partial [Mycobacterium sp.]|nr:alpha/beta hydrolase [Mycobacterium sp.]
LITTLDGVGHIPMFEAPDRIARLILDFVDGYTGRAAQTG